MTGEEFKELQAGNEVYVPDDNDEQIYRVLDKDNMGRIKMQKVLYYVDLFNYSDEKFMSHEEAEHYRQQLMDECLEGELEVEDVEEEYSDLKYAEIETDTFGKIFWMDYRDVELE